MASATASPQAYRVFARAYRPRRLSELVGQDAMVRTLEHAFRSGRIAHAFLLSGIRGVGKTTTARILARGLNCTGPDGSGGPTTEPCGECESCRAILEERSLDVIETDAASHTGKEDVREIIEGVKYAPSASRFKIYIFDEVHMLSDKAWNSLLKTVEEPPPHVKFIFATTEIRKVPVTVLSRCQRFDLRRVDGERLVAHLERICAREKVTAEPRALALVARAAEGSVRDALSLLDQAVATGDGTVTAAEIEAMLGLADRTRLLDLYEDVLAGRTREAIARFAELYGLGADPAAVIRDLLEITHWLTRIRLDAGDTMETAFDTASVARARKMAEGVSHPVLQRLWQMLLKGLEEVRLAPDAWAAAEMLLVRLTCVSELPPPGELARLLRSQRGETAASAPRREARPTVPADGATAATPPRPLEIPDFPTLVELLKRHGEPLLGAALFEGAHLISFETGRIVLRLEPGVSSDLPNQLSRALGRLTGRGWVVALGREEGAPTLAERRAEERRRRIEAVRQDPLVRTALETFPGARILDVRTVDDRGASTDQRKTGGK